MTLAGPAVRLAAHVSDKHVVVGLKDGGLGTYELPLAVT